MQSLFFEKGHRKERKNSQTKHVFDHGKNFVVLNIIAKNLMDTNVIILTGKFTLSPKNRIIFKSNIFRKTQTSVVKYLKKNSKYKT